MKEVTLKDKAKSVEIIAETFDNNPSVNGVIGNDGDRNNKIRRLAEYAFVKAWNRDGVYISDNGMGTALFFDSTINGFSLKELYYEIKFALSIPVSKVFQALKREAYLKEHRAYSSYYYFWFLGVRKGGGKAGFELKDIVFEKARKAQLPILLETSVPRNVEVYKRYGFTIYHEWKDEANSNTLWFMKLEPDDIR